MAKKFSVVLAATLLAAATLCFAPALAQNEATQPLYQLHGSGTSNPALIIWRVMDLMMARTKPRVAMSYRSVGSGSGAADFAAGFNAFGCGDVPLPNTTYTSLVGAGTTVLHVPFLVGSVSVFHNVPGIGEGLYLPPCTLARILRGDIAVWNHPDILADNAHLPDLATVTAAIRVVHRNAGSSSTYSVTHYFNKACPAQWSAVPGSPANKSAAVGSSRSVGVTTEWPTDAPGRWQTVQNSQEMVEQISGVPFSLGYVESGQGLNAGLSEVALQNANGSVLVSSDADVAPPAFIAEQFPLADLTSPDWVKVNPVYASKGNPRQWPLVLGTYFYVRANATFLGDAGGLLQLFLNFMLGPDVTALLPSYFFVPFSAADRATILAGISSALTLDPASAVAPAWRYEGATNNTFGQQNYVFSAKRDSYLTTTVAGLAADVADAKRTLMMGDAYQVHGSGSFVSAALLRRAMGVLQSRARVPVSMTYRSVGSAEAIAEYVDYSSMLHSYNHFKVSDMPLPTSVYTALNTDAAARAAIGATVQIPFAVAALGIFYNKALPTPALALSCRLLARAYSGGLTSWADQELVTANNFSSAAAATYLAAPVRVFGMAGPSGSTWALTGWLAASCGDVWPQGQTANATWGPQVATSYQAPGATANTTIRTPEDLAAALAATPGSLGYLPAALGASLGLTEAGLLLSSAAGAKPVRSADADLTSVVARARAATPTLYADATADLAAALAAAPNGGGLYGQSGGNGSWPMPVVQYMLMYRNLSMYGYSGPLLRAFAEFLLSAEGSALAAAAGLAPMPADVAAAGRADLARAALKTLTVVWAAEGAGSYEDTGSGLYTFSANRDSYEAAALAELQAQVADLQSQLAAALPTQLRLACASGLMPLTRLLRNDVQAIATAPVRLTDEVIPAAAAAASQLLAAEHAGAAAPVHLVLTPGPLSAAAWRAVAAEMPVVQMPAAIRPVAIVYKGLSGLRLSACSLARILRGEVTVWNAQPIKDDNPGLALPGNAIRLVTGGPEDADARAVAAWAADPAAVGAACGTGTGAMAIPAAGAVDNGRVLAEVAGGPLYTALGFVAASELAAAGASLPGLHAAALPSLVSNTFIRYNQTGAILDAAACPASGCGGAVAAAYGAALDAITAAASAAQLGLPPAVDGDWSNFTARPAGVRPSGAAADVYPVFRLDFYAAPADLVHFGAAGNAAAGLLAYGLSAGAADRINGALGPAFAGLGPVARQRLAAAALGAVQTAAAGGSGQWAIVASSANTSAAATASGAALVLSRLPPLADSALPGGDAALLAAASGSASSDTSGTAYQAAAEAVGTAWDKAVLAYDIAVAALVLACVLSVAALALAGWALHKVRRVEGAAVAGGGGCFTPAAAKYEKHTDAVHPPAAAGGAATTAVEMGAYDKI